MTAAAWRPRRSVLYTPADRPERIERMLAAGNGPDVLIADLEDGVSPDHKVGARNAIAEAFAEARSAASERCIRINPIDSPWHDDDLSAALDAGTDAIVLPKVESVEGLTGFELALEAHEERVGRDVGTTPLLVQLETARGIVAAERLAQTIVDPVAPLSRVVAFIFGAEDLAASVGARRTRAGHEVLYARSRVVLAAAMAGIQAIDQVFVAYKDAIGLAEDCRVGRDLGYVGKQLIHPDQVAVTHDVFTPSQAEIAEARDLLAAAAASGTEQGGAIGYKGRMVDRPVVEQARRIVALAEALGR